MRIGQAQVEVQAAMDELVAWQGRGDPAPRAAPHRRHPGVAVAVMRNRFATGEMTMVARIDKIVAETLS
jgi:hypothetical protein